MDEDRREERGDVLVSEANEGAEELALPVTEDRRRLGRTEVRTQRFKQ